MRNYPHDWNYIGKLYRDLRRSSRHHIRVQTPQIKSKKGNMATASTTTIKILLDSIKGGKKHYRQIGTRNRFAPDRMPRTRQVCL
eukprot:SAG22_NODE_15_length_32914_cov_20.713546_13_plen_85_part_00